MRALQARLPGSAAPEWVRDAAGWDYRHDGRLLGSVCPTGTAAEPGKEYMWVMKGGRIKGLATSREAAMAEVERRAPVVRLAPAVVASGCAGGSA